MEDYKSYLNESADDAEKTAAKTVLEGLSALRIEASVQDVAQKRKAYFQRKIRNRLLTIAIVIALAGLIAWLVSEYQATTSPGKVPSSTPVEGQQYIADSVNSNAPSRSQEAITSEPPIAQTIPAPRHKAPRLGSNIRGSNSLPQKRQTLEKVLDQIWYTDYPLTGLRLNKNFSEIDRLLRERDFETAYLRISRIERQYSDNDTLRYLKGYCLLEMGQSDQALNYLGLVNRKSPKNWKPQLQWYLALSMLYSGNQGPAIGAFRKIASDSTHPYCLQSKKAMILLE